MRDVARMVYRIIIKRRRLCVSQGRHTIGYCRNCGVHQ